MNNSEFTTSKRPRGIQGLLDKELFKLEAISFEEYLLEPEELPEEVEYPPTPHEREIPVERESFESTSFDDESSDFKPFDREEQKQSPQEPVDYTSIKTLTELLESSEIADSIKEEINELNSEGLQEKMQVAKKAVEMFNLVDQLRQAQEEKKEEVDAETLSQVQAIVSHSLALLREIGVHEVDVYGRYVDEEYMELLGTIPADDAPEDLQKYQVAVVCRRAFVFEGTAEIIQDALVKTVS